MRFPIGAQGTWGWRRRFTRKTDEEEDAIGERSGREPTRETRRTCSPGFLILCPTFEVDRSNFEPFSQRVRSVGTMSHEER